MGKRKVSDEALTAALLTHGTVRAAASALRIGETAIYQRMKDVGFRSVYEAQRDELLRDAVHRLSDRIGRAVDVLDGVMSDPDTNPAVRVSAARAVLEYADRLSDRMIQRGQQASKQAEEGHLADLINGLQEEKDPLTAAIEATLKAEAARLDAAGGDCTQDFELRE